MLALQLLNIFETVYELFFNKWGLLYLLNSKYYLKNIIANVKSEFNWKFKESRCRT